MGRCGGWGVGRAVLALAFLGASCGGSGGGPSDSGKPLVFQTRARLALAVQATEDPIKLNLTATLLDPQGVPFRNELVSFTAEFPDATFIPGDDNEGAVRTNDSGQASITLVAGRTTGNMRVVAEGPSSLNVSTGITVQLTTQGFVSLGDLGIIPSAVTFVNPTPHPSGGPADITFQAVGGTPAYQFSNSNPGVGSISTQGSFGQFGAYALTGPVPAAEETALQDTVTVQDAAGAQATATVQVLFVTCALNLSPSGDQAAPGTVTFGGARGGETFDIAILDGVPPYTATHIFPSAGTLSVNQQTGTVTYTIATPPLGVDPDQVLIRDSRGCTGTVEVTITPAPAPTVTTIVLTANPIVLNGVDGGTSTITATVLDENNQPIQNVTVLFETTQGSISPLTATTNASGQATTTLTIPANTPAGVAIVRGSAGGVNRTVSVAIVIAGAGPAGPPARIFVDLFADRSGNNNDGTCTTILSALVVDAEGNPVNDGTSVEWAAGFATGNIPVSVTTPSFTNQDPGPLCDTSTYEDATGQITPQPGDALACLKYPQSASGRTVTVTASSPAGQNPTASGSFDITLPLCPSGTASLTLEANPTSISAATGGSSTITATLRSGSQPLGGVTVFFTKDTVNGDLIPGDEVTDSNGQAQIELFIDAGTPTGSIAVTGTAAGGASETVTVTVN